MMHFHPVATFSFGTFLCYTLFMLHFHLVATFSFGTFYVTNFSCCIFSLCSNIYHFLVYTYFLLHSVQVALVHVVSFSCCFLPCAPFSCLKSFNFAHFHITLYSCFHSFDVTLILGCDFL